LKDKLSTKISNLDLKDDDYLWVETQTYDCGWIFDPLKKSPKPKEILVNNMVVIKNGNI